MFLYVLYGNFNVGMPRDVVQVGLLVEHAACCDRTESVAKDEDAYPGWRGALSRTDLSTTSSSAMVPFSLPTTDKASAMSSITMTARNGRALGAGSRLASFTHEGMFVWLTSGRARRAVQLHMNVSPAEHT